MSVSVKSAVLAASRSVCSPLMSDFDKRINSPISSIDLSFTSRLRNICDSNNRFYFAKKYTHETTRLT